MYKDDSSHKFWKINVAGNSLAVTYGKVGTSGAVKTKTFDTPEICQKEASKLIQSKLKKGYAGVKSSELIVRKSSMSDSLFWELLETAKKKGEDLEEQMEWLINHLSKKSVKDIVMFDYIFNQYYYKSYTSDLWAAAYIIMGGCSDDCFDYFRAWLLYLGKDVYEAALKDPEVIIPYLKPLEEEGEIPQLEELLAAASIAYEEKTGYDDDHYIDLYEQLTKDQYVEPDIEFDWEEDDEEGLKSKFPNLWMLYGETPL